MLDNETRQELASRLNEMVDIPWISEQREQEMAEKLIDVCLGPCLENEPDTEEMVQMSRSLSRETMEQRVTAKLVLAINKAIDVPFMDEAQEEKVLTMIVCYLMKQKFQDVADIVEDMNKNPESFCNQVTTQCAVM